MLTRATFSQDSPELISVSMSECIENCTLGLHIDTISLEHDTLFVKAGVSLNCSVNEAFFYLEEEVLNLVIYNSKDEDEIRRSSLCDCYYEIEYVIKNVDSLPKAVLVNGEKIQDYRN